MKWLKEFSLIFASDILNIVLLKQNKVRFWKYSIFLHRQAIKIYILGKFDLPRKVKNNISRNAYRGKCALNEKFTLQAKLKGQVNQVISGEAIIDGHSIWKNFRVRFCKRKNTHWHHANHLTVPRPGTKHLTHLFFHSSRL